MVYLCTRVSEKAKVSEGARKRTLKGFHEQQVVQEHVEIRRHTVNLEGEKDRKDYDKNGSLRRGKTN